LICDDTSRSGHYLSEALDIVAHEFGHSVVGADQDFVYESEPGALNEALSDVMGKCVEGFASTVIADSVGENFRDVVYPEKQGYPSKYSEFIYSDEDNGGVHGNAGVVSKPLSLMALESESTTAAGCTRILSLVLDYFHEVYLNPRLSLEDFAIGLSAYCQLHESASYCAELDDRLDDGELLGVE
ncbi:MAG: M4 family metallopeptidase, partial [Bdellovibrionota bacterium]